MTLGSVWDNRQYNKLTLESTRLYCEFPTGEIFYNEFV